MKTIVIFLSTALYFFFSGIGISNARNISNIEKSHPHYFLCKAAGMLGRRKPYLIPFVARKKIFVRSAPSRKARIVGTIRPGSRVVGMCSKFAVLKPGISGYWLYIGTLRSTGRDYFVFSYYLNPIGSDATYLARKLKNAAAKRNRKNKQAKRERPFGLLANIKSCSVNGAKGKGGTMAAILSCRKIINSPYATKSDKAKAYRTIAYIYSVMNNEDKSLEAMEKFINLCAKLMKCSMSNAFISQAIVYKMFGNKKYALNSLYKARKINDGGKNTLIKINEFIKEIKSSDDAQKKIRSNIKAGGKANGASNVILSLLKNSINYRKGSGEKYVRELTDYGLFYKSNLGSDYTEVYLPKKSVYFMGAKVIYVENEYQDKHVGCCPNPGISMGILPEKEFKLAKVKSIASKYKCAVHKELELSDPKNYGLKETSVKHIIEIFCRKFFK